MSHWSISLRRLSTALFWGVLVLAFLASLVFSVTSCVTGGSSVHPPQPPQFNEQQAIDTCKAIWRERCSASTAIPTDVQTACVEAFRHSVLLEAVRLQVSATDACRKAQTPTGRRGIVRAQGAVWLDDDGPRNYLGGSLFWALWGYEHDRARLLQNLVWLKSKDTDYIRVILSAQFGIVAPDPRSPTWEANIAGLVDYVYAHGMRTELTIFGWDDFTPTPDSRKKAVEAVARVAATRAEKIQLIEVGNELWQNFPNNANVPTSAVLSEVRDLGRYLQAHTRNLVALTAPRTDSCDEQQRWYSGNVGSAVTLHFSRDFTSDGPWRPVRQPWRESSFSCDGVARAYIDNERIGPQSSVNSDDDPLRLAIGCGVSWDAGMGACTLHTGAGISGQVDPARHRPANVFETGRITDITAALKATRTALPTDLAGWSKDASRPTRFFSLSDTDWDRIDKGRFYCAYRGSEFVCIPFAISGPLNPVAAKAMRVRILNPVTGAQLQDVTLAKGDKLPIGGTLPAVILRGTIR